MAIIDLVKWQPQTGEQLYAWKFPQSNLSTYTQLLVSESQEAILFSKGQIIGKFGPGKHTLDTENLPLLRSLYGLPFGGKNPFTAEVWFVNKLMPLNIDWTTDSMMYNDPDYQTMVPLIAKGRYGVKIVDAEKFLIKLVGTTPSFNATQLTENFLGATVSKTKSVLLQFILTNNIGIKKLSAYLEPLSESLRLSLTTFWEDYGFQLISFYITSIDVDPSTEAGKLIMEAMSRQSAQAIGGYSWQQSQAFEIAKDAVGGMSNNNGGLLGAIVASNMMGGLGGSIMQPQNNQPVFNQDGTGVKGGNQQPPIPPKEVYCSNCSKKFSSNVKFCPSCGDEYCPCPKCGTDNDKTAKRCVSCGQQLALEQNVCTNCNTMIVAGSAFCGNCGKPISEGKCTRCNTTLTPNVKFCPKCGQKNV